MPLEHRVAAMSDQRRAEQRTREAILSAHEGRAKGSRIARSSATTAQLRRPTEREDEVVEKGEEVERGAVAEGGREKEATRDGQAEAEAEAEAAREGDGEDEGEARGERVGGRVYEGEVVRD
eukprot:scaffold62723_cov32-Tisochrysis_lutea.AAC.3